MLRIGVPAGAEFVLLFVYIMIVYVIHSKFRSGSTGGIRRRRTRDAGALFAGGRAQLRGLARGRTKLRWSPGRSRSALGLSRDLGLRLE